MILKTLTVVALTMVLTSCAAIKENFGSIAGGASAIASAPMVEQAVIDWLDGDETAIASLESPAEFFRVGYNVLTEKGADIPVVQLAAESPDYVDAIPDNWTAIKTAFDEYEQRSGKPRPAVLVQFIANGEQAYSAAKKAIAANDKFQSACGMYSLAAPLAGMFSPIPLPSKIPGCA